MTDRNGSLKVTPGGRVNNLRQEGHVKGGRLKGGKNPQGMEVDDIKVIAKSASGYVLTSGMVARVCGVAARTASKWCDLGHLPHYRVPGSNDRRIYAHVLLKFMRDNAMDPPESLVNLIEGPPEVVTVGCPGHVPAGLTAMFGPPAGLPSPVNGYDNLWDAACYLNNPNRFGVIVIGSGVTTTDASLIINRVGERWVCLHALAPDQSPAAGAEAVVPEHERDRLFRLVGHYLEYAK